MNRRFRISLQKDLDQPSDINFYYQYVSGVVSLLEPNEDPEKIREKMKNVIQFEQQIAKIMMSVAEQRDFSKNLREITINDLNELANFKDFNWLNFLNGFFGEGKIKADEKVALYAESYYKKLVNVVESM